MPNMPAGAAYISHCILCVEQLKQAQDRLALPKFCGPFLHQESRIMHLPYGNMICCPLITNAIRLNIEMNIAGNMTMQGVTRANET